jgi:flagellar capping protein FliD
VSSGRRVILSPGQLAKDSVGSSQRVNLARLTRRRLTSQFQTEVSRLQNSLDQFRWPDTDNLYLAKGVVSSNEAVVSGQATTEAALATHRVRFDQPARAQQNRSVNLTPTDAPSLSAGTYTFDLTIGDDTHTLKVEVAHSGYTGQADTNLSLLGKIARQINGSDDRVRAEVVQTELPAYSSLTGGQDMTDQVAYLTITAQDVGDEAAFSLADETGDLVETYGLSRQNPSATRAIWKLNGVGQDSSDNDPQIDAGRVTLHLNTPGLDYQTLTVIQGKSAVLGDVSQVLGDYNNLVAFLIVNRDYLVADLAETFRREVLSRKNDLAQIGLKTSDQGLISMDESFLVSLDADYDAVQATLTGETGVFTALSTLADRLAETGADRYFKPADVTPAYSASTLARSLNLIQEGQGLFSLIA